MPDFDLKKFAIEYALEGIPVFPCRADKRPLTPNGFKDATTDPAIIEDWWQRFPDAMIGAPTGKKFSVLDLDAKKGKDGFAYVSDWKQRSPVIALTKNGGAHLYFQAEGSPRNSADDIAPGVDTRGDGGYVIMPPSSGYSWVNGHDLADLPPWPDDLRPKGKTKTKHKPKTGAATDTLIIDSMLAAACAAMLNNDLGWEEWNRRGMAIWAATSGSAAGMELWHAWSKKSKKYDAAETDDRWQRYAASPPTELGAGTIFFNADRDTPEWRADFLKEHFSCGGTSKPLARSQTNIMKALELLGVKLRYNAFSDQQIVVGLEGFDRLDDAAVERLWLLIDERFGFLAPKEFFWVVVGDAARRNLFHPVKDYLDNLKWDGKPRLDQWLITYANAKDTAYVRAVSAIPLIAAVRRVREPGCKFDEMLILEGAQGIDKSRALETLAIRSEWFSDDLPLNADGKRVIEQTRGRWIVEAAELSGMRKADIEHLKAALSRQADRARLAFARQTTEKRREFIVVGTTNNDRYLKDLSGNRRFWPVAVEGFDIERLRRDRDQLWAEAAAREAGGESIRLDSRLWRDAAQEQNERTVDDPWIDIIAKLLGDLEGKLLAADAWTLVGITNGQQTQDHNNRLGMAMRQLGWKRDKLRFGGKDPENCYRRGDSKEKVLRRILVLRTDNHGTWAGYEGEDRL